MSGAEPRKAMATMSKWLLWIVGTMLLAILASVLLIEDRHGHYPTFAPSSFSTIAPAAAEVTPGSDPLVQLATGTLRGAVAGSSVVFRGIPYARPPVGELRWAPPQPPLPWQGVRDALQAGNACTQRPSGLTPFFAPMAQAYGGDFEQPP